MFYDVDQRTMPTVRFSKLLKVDNAEVMGLFPGPETRQRNATTERPLQRHCLHLVIIDPSHRVEC